ncbi:DUF11 domain-containing protein [Wenzhouxiangella marina]|uniref:Uncharacterized protein n=1 Tax=Wenzhouxiangella marina TaxID=1579979 RepID=A0A0K0XUY2_9GAMM|nr:DUF11 domain-containing protein [Wenzhouxiangella marina]AKS41519.1 hypothetical protein WM2015_1145 [Wenzhouxiangella marina]MBB6086722.1 putative repeat protein (TIGR01451 family) [Wenzhouxiangella marina]
MPSAASDSTGAVAAALAFALLALLVIGPVVAAPPTCPTPAQGYEIAGCFVDGNGDEYPAGGSVDVYDLAFGQSLSASFPAGIFVTDAFQVAPPSSPPASCGSCGPIDFCVVVAFEASAAGAPIPQSFCAPGDPTVNQGGFDLRSLAGDAPIPVIIPAYTVGGEVTGLEGSGLVLTNNGVDALPIAIDGDFTFPTPVNDGLGYDVAVASQPTGPSQDCTVTNETGTIDGADVTDVSVVCVTRTADLSVSKTDGTNFIPPGEPVVYTITVANAGPQDVVGARVLDVLPATLSSASWSCVADAGASCPVSGSGDIDAFVDLAAGSAAVFTLTATTVADPDAVVINTVELIEPNDVIDPDSSNNSATDTTILDPVIFQDRFETANPR